MATTTITTHTPGPWVIEQSYEPMTGPRVYVNAEIENNGTSAPGGTFSIAEVCDDSYVTPYGSQEANARLIAAAPDLLNLARQYLLDMRYPVFGDDSRLRRAEAIEMVLAKVEGKASHVAR